MFFVSRRHCFVGPGCAVDREGVVIFIRDFDFAPAGRSITGIITKTKQIADRMLGAIGSRSPGLAHLHLARRKSGRDVCRRAAPARRPHPRRITARNPALTFLLGPPGPVDAGVFSRRIDAYAIDADVIIGSCLASGISPISLIGLARWRRPIRSGQPVETLLDAGHAWSATTSNTPQRATPLFSAHCALLPTLFCMCSSINPFVFSRVHALL